MEIHELIDRFSTSPENQGKAIFSTLFIAGNRLQTLFDNHVPDISLKQFMLLTMIRQSREPLTFTQLGRLLGCSRQNIKKLAYALEKKGFVSIEKSQRDVRALNIFPTQKLEEYFGTVFSAYQKDLRYLFAVYTPEELNQLFVLMMKLYEGIDHLEQAAQADKNPETAEEIFEKRKIAHE